MESVIRTPRLKLTLITTAGRGSPELEWLHILRSDEKCTWWSILPRSKTLEDTENAIKRYLPTDQPGDGTYRVVYAVHEVKDESAISLGSKTEGTTRFIGLVNLISLNSNHLALPDYLTIPAAENVSTLTVEVAYMFLPEAWGRGYATESVLGMFETCKKTLSFWTPYKRVYIRSIVNDENLPSQRVMEKTGMEKRGIYEVDGRYYIAGRWQEHHVLHIYGKYLLD